MASHAPNPADTAALLTMLASLPLSQEVGLDASKSQHGIQYRTIRAIGPDSASLISWMQQVLNTAISAGATTLVLRTPPDMTIFENGRKFSKGLVMRFHVLPDEANAVLPPSSEGGPATNIG